MVEEAFYHVNKYIPTDEMKCYSTGYDLTFNT